MIKVIIPVYKTEQYLKRCVDSILAQTEKEYYIVLIDDGSPDHSGEICDEYVKKYDNIFAVHQSNQGIAAARNAGIDFPRECDYITFVDSDDWVHPRYLEVLLRTVKNTGCAIAACECQKVNNEPEPLLSSLFMPLPLKSEDYYCTNSICSMTLWGKLYRKDMFLGIRFPVGKLFEDTYTTWKILFKTDKVAVIIEPLYYYFFNREGISKGEWTPAHMGSVYAYLEHIEYFEQNHYTRALRKAKLLCNCAIHSNIIGIQKTKYKTEYLPILLELKEKYKKM